MPLKIAFSRPPDWSCWELRNIYHHHPDSKIRKSSEANSGSIQPYGRYGSAVKTSKPVSTIAILWPAKAILEKRAATVEADTFTSPVLTKTLPDLESLPLWISLLFTFLIFLVFFWCACFSLSFCHSTGDHKIRVCLHHARRMQEKNYVQRYAVHREPHACPPFLFQGV